MTTSVEDAIKSAASVARDAAEGRLDPTALDGAVADECRSLFGVVVGPDDPLWALHVDVARQVLGLGGVTTDELSEWLAVARRRERPDAPAEPSVEPFDCSDRLGGDLSVSEPHSPENHDSLPDVEPRTDL